MSPRAVLVGPPGAGKTVVGRLLADRLGADFRDTDADVERLAGKPIPEIFTNDGEPAFREREEEAIAVALAEHSGVLSLGGGAVLSERTRERLVDQPVAFLSVGLAEGARRTGLSTARPLLAGVNPRATFKALLQARLPLYRQVATWEVDTDEIEPPAVVDRIVAGLQAARTS
ncbi:shikimate kinase [Halopolyspora algeriensis]|uniref:Shikimate kinase n=1 Tax=Halopolyspora algeriensis TaxID=1500506 RepID=A0A368VQJ3_9ACTN|nr:shikimate kinase [Halopolyspora algeriensis]RCW43878.1 shikimate kinase [Halopolyspora algeriensis]TQM53619.1 shikimate kinase [Halopolyspora algeriensis]